MQIGIPKETFANEFRVGLTPASVQELVKLGHNVFVETNAGVVCGYTDELYETSGAVVCENVRDVYKNSEIIIKIKELQAFEFEFLKKNQILLCHINSKTDKNFVKVLLDKKVTAIAYDYIERNNEKFPIMVPLDEIAGKIAVQLGANYLYNHSEIPVCRGILLGGIAGVYPAKVCVIGAGAIGLNAAMTAAGAGASVVVLDYDVNKLRTLEKAASGRVQTLFANEMNVAKSVREADLLICAIKSNIRFGGYVVTERMVESMRHGSVIVDTELDFYPSVETMEKMDDLPYILKKGVIHCNSSNLAGLVPRTSTIAFNNVLLSYLFDIVNSISVAQALKSTPALSKGVIAHDGELTNAKLANSLDLKYTELSLLIGF